MVGVSSFTMQSSGRTFKSLYDRPELLKPLLTGQLWNAHEQIWISSEITLKTDTLSQSRRCTLKNPHDSIAPSKALSFKQLLNGNIFYICICFGLVFLKKTDFAFILLRLLWNVKHSCLYDSKIVFVVVICFCSSDMYILVPCLNDFYYTSTEFFLYQIIIYIAYSL